MKSLSLLRPLTVMFILLFIGATAQAATVLTSVKTDKPVLLSGDPEMEWEKAPALEVTLDNLPYEPENGYPGMKETKVKLKSMYDKDYIYFLIQYADPTESLARFPWVKQKDGSWKQLANKDQTGHENTYYEDKVGLFWNINTKGFSEAGCMISCHLGMEGDTSPGRKFTNAAGETIDMWHVKNVRTSPLGQVDDQYVDNTNTGKVHKNWGRKGDNKTGGGYTNNINEAKTGPVYMNYPPSEQFKYMVVPTLKTPFIDIFKPGDVVPGIIIDAFEGPRADIEMGNKWKNGVWTIEIRRKLVTTGEGSETQDVQFDDLGKVYPFGIAVFDNTQINHLFHIGSLSLRFK